MLREMTRPYWVHSDPAPAAAACVCCDRPAHGRSLMCGGCFVRMRTNLDTLVVAHHELGADMTAIRSSRRDGGGRMPAGPRLPFSTAHYDTRDLIEGLLTTWARAIGEEHEPAIPGPADGRMPTIGRWIADRLQWVSDQYWCDAMASELGEVALSVRGLVPTEPRRRELPGWCPGCRMLSLVAYDGDEFVLCRIRTCGRRMSWGEYGAMYHGPTYKPSVGVEAGTAAA